MSTSHTPGPWKILAEECDKPYIQIRGTCLGGRYKIANVLTPTYAGVAEGEAKETRGNARLIAEAPDLLAVLQWLDRKGGIGLDVHDRISAAIAKATS